MGSRLPTTALLILAMALFYGCGSENTQENVAPAEVGHPHSHEGGDELVWVADGIEHEGYLLSLGHHGKHLHAVSFVEPAVAITRDGVAVADARVFNSLLSADGAKVIREEVATIYEPETEAEPAHYAQGKLHMPKGSEKFVIRFRIELPGVETTLVRDITIQADE